MDVVWGPGGTGAEAVERLLEACASPALGTSPMLLAPSREEFESARARIVFPLGGVDFIVATSGSSDGRGRLVGLSLAALAASARATHARLGGPGQWLSTLPVHGVAGLQVVLRSVLAGIEPVVYGPASGFDADGFAERVASLRRDVPRYCSLVPTQLHRLLASHPGALAAFTAILVGGAALPADLAAQAQAAGARLVSTYGLTESSGGCVYDGVPLEGVSVRLVGGLVQVAGPVLATHYLDDGDQPFVVDADGTRWLTTHDRGEWHDGRLRVLGRADDVIVSGGANVDPHEVEAALASLRGQWVVVGVPDPEWGQLVVAVTDAATGPGLDGVRAATAGLPGSGRPRALVRLDPLPVRPSGKVDRRAAAALAARELARGRGERLGRA